MSSLVRRTSVAFLLAGIACTVRAVDWSDSAISYRYGTRFEEPFNGNDIAKNIVNLSSAFGDQYGKNFFSADWLLSSKQDPSAPGSRAGAYEVYVLYRHTFDLGKIGGRNLAFGPVRGVGITGGFDFNSKADASYNSRKRMLVAGPTLMLDVPGFLDVSLLTLWESNAPHDRYTGVATPRYAYRAHQMLSAAWGIPFELGVPLSFAGYADLIGAKDKNEFGADTAREPNIDLQIMYDLGVDAGMRKNTFKVGVEYQYWKNKFGNSDRNNSGATAKTPMIRAEYHF